MLPWLAHAALFLAPRYDADRRRRAAWRTSLWLALLDGVRAGRLAAGAGRGRGRARRKPPRPADLGLAVGVVTPLVATLVLLLPWSVATWSHQGAASWLFEAGLPTPGLVRAR